MLHERRLPDIYAQDLERVYLAKLGLLDWLLRSPPDAFDDDALLVQRFGPALGDWLWARIRRPQTRTAFGNAVVELASKARASPVEAVLVANAITHDAQFHTQWNVVGSALQFPRLYPLWLEVIKEVAVPFYEWFGSSGFDPEPFGLTAGRIDRVTVMKSFRPQSYGVCGYCDGPLGDLGSESEANDCDHFFPKSEWPHLAIHPANLFSACKGCNTTWKLAKKPMGTADVNGLHGTYHPLLRPGVSAVVVRAVSSRRSARQVEIKITDPAAPRRAETLVSTLDLEGRWTNSVNDKMDRGVSTLVAKTIRDRGFGRHSDSDSVKQLIEDDISWKEAQLGKEERCLREIAALKYLRDDLLHELVADLT